MRWMPSIITRRTPKITTRIRIVKAIALKMTKNAKRLAKMPRRKPRRQLKKLRKRPLRRIMKSATRSASKRILF